MGVGVVRLLRRWRDRDLTAPPPSPPLPHRKSGLPDLRKINTRPGQARGAWGEGAHRVRGEGGDCVCGKSVAQRRSHRADQLDHRGFIDRMRAMLKEYQQ